MVRQLPTAWATRVGTEVLAHHVKVCTDALLANQDEHGRPVIKATKYVSPTLVVKITRRLHAGKVAKRSRIDLVVTIGVPNFRERDFIRACRTAGEKFPVAKVQLKYLRPRR